MIKINVNGNIFLPGYKDYGRVQACLPNVDMFFKSIGGSDVIIDTIDNSMLSVLGYSYNFSIALDGFSVLGINDKIYKYLDCLKELLKLLLNSIDIEITIENIDVLEVKHIILKGV